MDFRIRDCGAKFLPLLPPYSGLRADSQEILDSAANLVASNVPRYVHVSRWAQMSYWAALFRTPEFSRLSAHGNEHYTISASAFLPVE